MKPEEQQLKDLKKAEKNAVSVEYAPDLKKLAEQDKKEDPPPPPSLLGLENAGIAMQAVEFATAYIAGRSGEHWLLSDEEKEKLKIALARVIDQFFPATVQSPLIALAIVSGSIFLPRALLTVAINAQGKRQHAEEVINGD